MSRKVFDELEDLFKPLSDPSISKSEIESVERLTKDRNLKLYFNQILESYIKEKKITREQFSKKDIKILTNNYNPHEKEVFIQQVMYHLETNRGKPLKRIKENKNCALFQEIDNNGGTNKGAEDSN